jgi:hypothetical protein
MTAEASPAAAATGSAAGASAVDWVRRTAQRRRPRHPQPQPQRQPQPNTGTHTAPPHAHVGLAPAEMELDDHGSAAKLDDHGSAAQHVHADRMDDTPAAGRTQSPRRSPAIPVSPADEWSPSPAAVAWPPPAADAWPPPAADAWPPPAAERKALGAGDVQIQNVSVDPLAARAPPATGGRRPPEALRPLFASPPWAGTARTPTPSGAEERHPRSGHPAGRPTPADTTGSVGREEAVRGQERGQERGPRGGMAPVPPAAGVLPATSTALGTGELLAEWTRLRKDWIGAQLEHGRARQDEDRRTRQRWARATEPLTRLGGQPRRAPFDLAMQHPASAPFSPSPGFAPRTGSRAGGLLGMLLGNPPFLPGLDSPPPPHWLGGDGEREEGVEPLEPIDPFDPFPLADADPVAWMSVLRRLVDGFEQILPSNAGSGAARRRDAALMGDPQTTVTTEVVRTPDGRSQHIVTMSSSSATLDYDYASMPPALGPWRSRRRPAESGVSESGAAAALGSAGGAPPARRGGMVFGAPRLDRPLPGDHFSAARGPAQGAAAGGPDPRTAFRAALVAPFGPDPGGRLPPVGRGDASPPLPADRPFPFLLFDEGAERLPPPLPAWDLGVALAESRSGMETLLHTVMNRSLLERQPLPESRRNGGTTLSALAAAPTPAQAEHCFICLDSDRAQAWAQMPCCRNFAHLDCARRGLQNDRRCAICRAPIP